jgi:type II secretory pathway component PulF
MPLYRCELVDAEGRVSEATREAASEEEAAALFSRGDRYLVSIESSAGGASRSRRGFKPEDVREFTIVLSALLESGLALKEGLAVASEIARKGSGMRRLVDALLESVRKGDSLSKAIAARGEGFSAFYRGMVGIGERIGSVERVLPRLASYLTDRKKLRERISGALIYPAIVCAFAALGAVGILVFLVPRMLEIFSELGGAAAAELRRSAAAMARASYCAGAVGLVLLATAFSVAHLRRRDEELAMRIDALALRLPLAGRFFTALETLNFAYAMDILTGGGISVEAGLGEAAEAVGNRAFRGAVARCREAALKGEPLSFAAGKCRELPPRVAQWLAIGERSGQVERVFEQLRRYYQGEVDRMSSRFMELTEPVLILLVGCLVLILVLVFLVPLFSMYGAML